MNLEIRHLKLVKAIVEEGSMANAINILNLSPSALSHQLKEAESLIGAKIFNRINKKLILTEIGEKVLISANTILNEMNRIEIEIKQQIQDEVGKIRICMECYSNYYWLPRIIKNFDINFPNIKIEVSFNAQHHPINKLLNGNIDLVITSDRVDDNNIEYIELFENEMVALISENHKWNEKDFVVAEDFVTENLFIYSGPIDIITVYQEVLKPAGLMPAALTELPNTETSVEMVRAEMGVMVVPKWTLNPYLLNNQLSTVRVTEKGLFIKQYVAILNNNNRPKYYDYFIKFLKEEIEL
ncbi:MAG: LysR family transcriptional regulator [bacterium]